MKKLIFHKIFNSNQSKNNGLKEDEWNINEKINRQQLGTIQESLE